MTANDLIKRALRLIGAIAPGEAPSAGEATDGLTALNSMLSSWSTEGLNLRQNTREVFSLVPGQSVYTFGLTGNFNSPRPVRITNASVMDGIADTFETRLDIITADQFANIQNKGLASGLPTHLFIQGTAPLETIQIYPVPSATKSIVIYSQKSFGGFALVTDIVALPEGYDRAIAYNLALEIAPEYGREPSAVVAMTAQESKAMLMRLNTEPVFMVSDAFGLSDRESFNILTGV